ncbi:MAG TPA: signal peptidase II [Steroidobacteraceae bacterium]|nr:signal peptidase II [Steroidobacteraceae bacterium]
MRRLSRLLLVATLLFGCVGCDQLTKSFARAHLVPGVVASYAHDTVRVVYAQNPGAFLSMGAGMSPAMRAVLFQGGVGLVVLGLLIAALLWRRLRPPQIVALSLLAASGLGNLIDRLARDGQVTDFLNLGLGNLRTGIFNVADVVGVAGALMLLLVRRDNAPPEPSHP